MPGMTDIVRDFLLNFSNDAFTYADVKALLAVLLVSLICGLVGPLVVGGRMAFFSDAMAHTAIAGAAAGVFLVVLAASPTTTLQADEYEWVVPLAMVGFGAMVGIAIQFFRDRTGLTADTVIGVFFALSIGFAAMILPELSKRVRFDAEAFLFGSPLYATEMDLLLLLGLALLALLFLIFRFNGLVFASFNPSLARSRGIGATLNSYLFIVLLSLVVNLSIKAVGVLLINALLVVPAAAAANVSRDLRQMTRICLASSVLAGVCGYLLCWKYAITLGGETIHLRPGGTIVVLVVAWFFFTAFAAYLRGRRQLAGMNCEC
jgi:zinc transport system permease protein